MEDSMTTALIVGGAVLGVVAVGWIVWRVIRAFGEAMEDTFRHLSGW
jgi:hypothetical protein